MKGHNLEIDTAEIRSQLESEQYQADINATCAMRAKTGSAFNRFLMDNRFGQLLTQAGIITHPVLKEKDQREEAISRLAGRFLAIDPALSEEDARLIAMTEKDFQPKKPLEVILENQIEHRIFWRKALETQKEIIDGKISDYFELQSADFGQLADSLDAETRRQFADLFEGVLEEKKYVCIRDICLKAVHQGDWQHLLKFLFQNFRDFKTAPYLREFFQKWRHRIFTSPGFRQQLVNFMINTLIGSGRQMFDDFDAFLFSLELDLSGQAEKNNLVDAGFPEAAMEKLWTACREDYFMVVEKLFRVGLLPEKHLSEAELPRKVVEFTLLALHGRAELKFLKNTLRPLAAELGLFDGDQLHLSERHTLYGIYLDLGMLCGKQPLPELREIYRRRRHEDI